MKMRKLTLLAPAVCGAFTLPAYANSYVWNGSTNGNWNNSANWTANGIPGSGDTVTFSGSANDTVSLNGNESIGTINFTDNNGFTINNNTLTLDAGGSILKSAASSQSAIDTINSNIALSGNATFGFAGSGGVVNQGGIPLQFTGTITGNSSSTLTITGPGFGVLLSGNNTGLASTIQVNNGAYLNPASSTSLGTGVVNMEAGSNLELQASDGTIANTFNILGNVTQNSYSGSETLSGAINISSSATFSSGQGGGNPIVYSGVIGGNGNINFTYGGVTISGTSSNTLGGMTTVSASSSSTGFDTVTLDKTGGAVAIAGSLTMSNSGILIWDQSNEIASTSAVTMAGGTLMLSGFSNTLGTLTLTGQAYVDMSGGASSLKFGNSSSTSWTGTELLVDNWTSSDNLSVGTTASGLTSTQLNLVGFVNPTGFSAGLYHAAISSSGVLTPTGSAVTATSPLWDMSAPAVAARAAVYNVPGMANLSGSGTNLKANETVSFFGDSITWLNGYITDISSALASGAGSKNLNIQLLNHGINGGGVSQILNGYGSNAYNGGNNNGAQAAFASVIASDHSTVAVVFIGVNDVNGVSNPVSNLSQYQTNLTTIVDQGQAQGVKMVLCTVDLDGELPDGQNAHDTAMDQYAQAARDVAAATGATLVDLRTAAIDYEENNNYTLQLNGSLQYASEGVLTYDGIHPTTDGNTFLANLISEGIQESLAVPEPASMSVLLLGSGLLLRRRRNR